MCLQERIAAWVNTDGETYNSSATGGAMPDAPVGNHKADDGGSDEGGMTIVTTHDGGSHIGDSEDSEDVSGV